MIESILLIVVISVVYLFYITNKHSLVAIKASNSSTTFFVQNRPDKQRAANVIHSIKSNIDTLMEILIQDTEVPFNKKYLDVAKQKLQTTQFRESIENSQYTSYSVNKGEEIVLCVRSKITNKIHDLDVLMYVAIHELAHVICPEIGHTKLFNLIFQYILSVAEQHSLYNYTDYAQQNTEYCGIMISQNILNK